ncbi:GGDEF domain-containing protein [Motilibacter aurantiacus]|uniref:GGDEF domain-containing protein n=1 Tax=Motilibacter aurantiacus TaxID=2714955 RepID=UPI001407600C|nr:GGDEF domain-containing protein [Motilibacter aurantiacus]NHC44907.1 GGDEF domain-containing protein [Motilibacter aurantiacus]
MGTGTRAAHQAFEDAPSAMVICTPQGVVLEANDALSDLLGRSTGSLVGTSLFEITHPEDASAAHAACASLNEGGSTSRLRCRLLTGHGAAVRVMVNSRLVERSGTQHIVMVVDDMTDLQAAQEHLTHLALHDPLTGLANRRLLDDRLAQAVAALERSGSHVAVLYLDLDGFKAVNDRHGHATGDIALCEVASRLSAELRAVDTASRIGGDEFAVLAVDVTEEQALALAGRLAQAVAEPIGHEGGELRLSASVGVALGHPSDSPADVLARADRAMYDLRAARARA